jgi:poly-gamma-glutamate capsule biosynthesis protein CapA/YwtB (metallophosphatase superfamily)
VPIFFLTHKARIPYTPAHWKQVLITTTPALSRNGIVGVGTSEKFYAKIQHNDHSIAILAYTAITDYKNDANIRLWDPVLCTEEISRMSREADYTIVLMHWGSEFISEPSLQQVMMGPSIIDARANLVSGLSSARSAIGREIQKWDDSLQHGQLHF